MALTPVELPTFGGLDLRTDPENISLSGAVDMLDVELKVRGMIRSRSGFTKFSSPAAADRLWNLNAVGQNLFAGAPATSKVYAFTTSGSSTASAVLPYGPCLNMVGIDGSAYGGNGNVAGTTLAKWDGAAWSYPVVGYSAFYVAVQSPDNRLVLVDERSTVTGYRVRFSNAGAATTFSANDYVDLTPGDGNTIQGTASFDNKLFVFKQTKFFVFYGNSTDGSGNAIFNYRTVNTGKGLTYPSCCVASPSGVYFLARDGIYLTTGGNPVKVSGALDAIFRGGVPPLYGGSSINWGVAGQGYPALTWFNDRLYFTCSTGASASQNRLFVLDPEVGWLVWSVPAAGICPWFAAAGSVALDALYFTYAAGTNDVGVFDPTTTTDAGSAISAKYRTGFWNPGKPGSEADIFEWLVDGSGTVTTKTAVNDGATLGTGQALTLGTYPAIAQGRDGRGVWGRNLSLELSGTAPWIVERVVANVSSQTQSGYKAA